MPTRSRLLMTLLAIALPACAVSQAEPAVEEAAFTDVSTADRPSDSSTYYLIRPDLRRCAAPGCGGSFVQRANYATTVCVDGSRRDECYVASVDYSKTKLDDNDLTALGGRPMVVKGTIAKQTYGWATYGNLVVSEVWVAAVDNGPSCFGTLYRVVDLGVRCLTSPCPSDRETKLNSGRTRDIAGVDLSETGASDDQIADAYAAMTTVDGILVDGMHTLVSGTGGTSVQLSATNFYTLAVHQEPPAGDPPLACGGIAGVACPASQFCDAGGARACGAVDVAGVCKAADVLCAQIYQPVCGCDGKTYGNDCERVSSRVQLDHVGACN